MATNLLQLPTELFHHIFHFLDYVRDICKHPQLSRFNFPTQDDIKQALDYHRTDLLTHFEFYEPQTMDVTIALTCREFADAVSSFRPVTLSFRLFSSVGCQRRLYHVDRYVFGRFAQHLTKHLGLCSPSEIPYGKMVIREQKVWLQKMKDFMERKRENLQSVEHVGLYHNSTKTFFEKGYDYVSNWFPFFKYFKGLKYFTCDAINNSHEEPIIAPKKILINQMYANFLVDEHVIKPSPNYYALGFKYSIQGSGFMGMMYSLPEDATFPKMAEYIQEMAQRIPRQYHHFEPHILALLHKKQFQQAHWIIEYAHIDIDYFSYLWNIVDDQIEILQDASTLRLVITFLIALKEKYKQFKIIRFTICSENCLEIIEETPLIEWINVPKNITTDFYSVMISNKNTDLLERIVKRYGYYVGPFGLALLYFGYNWVASLVQKFIPQYDINSTNLFGQTPDMVTLMKTALVHISETPFSADPRHTDFHGNNLMHYVTIHGTKNYNLPLSKGSTETIQQELMLSRNNHGVAPLHIQCWRWKIVSEESDRYKVDVRLKKLYSCFPDSIIRFHGLLLTCPLTSFCKHPYHNGLPSEYAGHRQDITARDVNGKHLAHYVDQWNYFSLFLHITVPFLTLKDSHGEIPLQTFRTLKPITETLLLENIFLDFDCLSYTDDYGWNRFMHLWAHEQNPGATSAISVESRQIGFDFSNPLNPLFLTLQSIHHQDTHETEWIINRTPLPKPSLKKETFVEFVEGDDMTHFLIRYMNEGCNGHKWDSLFVLIKQGLRLNVTKNSRGQTAMDLLDPKLKIKFGTTFDQLKKKQNSRSKAQVKIHIKLIHAPTNKLIEKTEHRLVSKFQPDHRVILSGSLFFDKKPNKLTP